MAGLLLKREDLAVELCALKLVLEGAAAFRRRRLDRGEIDAEAAPLREFLLDETVQQSADLIDVAAADVDAHAERQRRRIERRPYVVDDAVEAAAARNERAHDVVGIAVAVNRDLHPFYAAGIELNGDVDAEQVGVRHDAGAVGNPVLVAMR